MEPTSRRLCLIVHCASTLAIHDSCPDQRRKRNACRYTADPRRCGAFPNDALAARLQELPNLHSVTISKKKSVVHGLGWNTVLAILCPTSTGSRIHRDVHLPSHVPGRRYPHRFTFASPPDIFSLSDNTLAVGSEHTNRNGRARCCVC